VTAAAISLIESGRRRASADMLRYIAARLGTTEDYLLKGRAPDLDARLRLDTERCRFACHDGKATEVMARLDEVIAEARRFDLGKREAAAREVRALALRKQGRYNEAIEEYDRSGELLASAPVEARVGAVTGRARCLYLMNDVGYAAHVLESYLTDLRRRPFVDPSAAAHVHTALVGPYFKMGFVDKARAAAEEAHRLVPRVTDPDVIGCTYINLASVYLGDRLLDEAIHVLSKAEDSFRQLDWTEEIVTTQLAQGLAFIEKEEWHEARSRLRGALRAVQALPGSDMHPAVLNQLGKVERMAGHFVKAEKYLTEARGLLVDGDLNERGFAQRELGLCAKAGGDDAAARQSLLEAIDCYRIAGNAQQLGVTYIELGDLERDLGDGDASARSYREGLELATAPQAGA
jgi:tetratricopeptide (TPR) repeat protein